VREEDSSRWRKRGGRRGCERGVETPEREERCIIYVESEQGGMVKAAYARVAMSVDIKVTPLILIGRNMSTNGLGNTEDKNITFHQILLKDVVLVFD
jgi:hypothetical protein